MGFKSDLCSTYVKAVLCVIWCCTCFKLKSCSELKFCGELPGAHKLFLNLQIVSKLCTEHGRDTAMLCAKFQYNVTTEMDVMDEWDFVRVEFKISFWAISYTAKALGTML